MILAKAGLLDGEPASIHWQFHDGFEETFPKVNLRRSVFVSDSRFPTASGGTAAADLMLHLIGEAHGSSLAIEIADQMVYNGVRGEGGEQRLSIQARHGMRNQHISEALRLMEDSTHGILSTAEIASQLSITPRQLERLFSRYLKCSPKKYATRLRLNRARNLLLQTEISITEIAQACGFGSASHFSRVYREHFGVSPSFQRALPSPI